MAERDGAGSPHRTQGVAGTWPPRGAAQGAISAPSPSRAWSSLLERLRAWVRTEAGAGRLLPWVPIAFGAGIALYFTASHEPVVGERGRGSRIGRGRLPAAA
jgi:competence protein ComEC